MKILQNILITCALALGLSGVASAQKDDKRPPKERPPVVNPQPKPAPTPEPKKPKPNATSLVWKNDVGETL